MRDASDILTSGGGGGGGAAASMDANKQQFNSLP